MAKFVACRSKEEAMAAAAAGVLYTNRNVSGEPCDYKLDPDGPEWVDNAYNRLPTWPPKDFAIRVEDDDG